MLASVGNVPLNKAETPITDKNFMTKQELIKTFSDNHYTAISYIQALPESHFSFRHNEKWTAGQQLKHILLTLLPFPKVLQSKDFISEKFGTLERAPWDYDAVRNNYLKTSRQAPKQFLPEEIATEQKELLIAQTEETLETISQLLALYKEDELDRLALPHPLLGKLSIREMFYLMSYHPIHHLNQIKANLTILNK
ncbi:DinB family protein [Sphingobacterium sp.]|uniref:DinB family protein n=1 Tax=Sphingobacterium sp. TaxID=341027 RepID=UPI0028A77BAD|nr:DinB family protein [Sphingobacterium sp.]